jgi:hypothetical protein
MADPRQRIVLCIEIDSSPTFPADDLESRLETVRVPRDFKAQVSQELANGVVGFVFFVSEFGVLEDLC